MVDTPTSKPDTLPAIQTERIAKELLKTFSRVGIS